MTKKTGRVGERSGDIASTDPNGEVLATETATVIAIVPGEMTKRTVTEKSRIGGKNTTASATTRVNVGVGTEAKKAAAVHKKS
mmetsp:Transcript_6177/g.9254  ORF Transcript_6177/g.9254 Transcript_6177/m.9254 type:complete len:83 (+) Transcript_6177:213-461(+)